LQEEAGKKSGPITTSKTQEELSVTNTVRIQ
jgi:hypothetical protein